MDCERFNQVVIDLLYAEVDPAVVSQLQQHLERCEGCAMTLSNLRAARKLLAIPVFEPPVGVEEPAMRAGQQYCANLPWYRRLAGWVSWAGRFAMHPQIAMGALLVLIVGSGLLLMRAQQGSWQAAVVRVTERGVPEVRESETVAQPDPVSLLAQTAVRADPSNSVGANAAGADTKGAALRSDDMPVLSPTENTDNNNADDPARAQGSADDAASDAPAMDSEPAELASASEANPEQHGTDSFADALSMYQSKNYAAAYRAFDRIALAGGPKAASAAMYAARSVRISAGCSHALHRFDAIATKYRGMPEAIEAKWQSAACARILGDYIRARLVYRELAQIDGLRERAEKELARIPPGHGAATAPTSSASESADPAPDSSAGSDPAGAEAPSSEPAR